MSDTKPWYAKFEAEATREMFRDFWLQVRAKFSMSDDYRELFSTVTRGWVTWQVILVLLFFGGCALSFSEGKWFEGFLQFMVGMLFALIAFYEMLLNVARKRLDQLFDIARDQQNTMQQMMAAIDPTYQTGEFD